MAATAPAANGISDTHFSDKVSHQSTGIEHVADIGVGETHRSEVIEHERCQR